jgi:hypothetical protein
LNKKIDEIIPNINAECNLYDSLKELVPDADEDLINTFI